MTSLNVLASCSSDHERDVISGRYHPVGVFNGHIIYEKDTWDVNQKWWSMRFETVGQRWIFMFLGHHIMAGKYEFGTLIENCVHPNTPG